MTNPLERLRRRLSTGWLWNALVALHVSGFGGGDIIYIVRKASSSTYYTHLAGPIRYSVTAPLR